MTGSSGGKGGLGGTPQASPLQETLSGASPPLPANVMSFVGPANSGKTELICRLVTWFRGRGLKVAVLKHSHKAGLGESGPAHSWRQAGAWAVARAGPHLVQVNRYARGEPELTEILAALTPEADLVLVEGYKQSPLPKIALTGPGLENIPLDRSRVVAWVSREGAASPVPVFHPDHVAEIGAFILAFLGISSKRTEN